VAILEEQIFSMKIGMTHNPEIGLIT